jgi:hypothetical protein
MSDELRVLGAYREFIALGTPETWVEFANKYHFYRFSRMNKKDSTGYLNPLTLKIMEDMLMNIQSDKIDYTPILTNQGFRNIARVIRQCTVIAQSKGDASPFKVRHGLGSDLLRQAHNSVEFISVLSKFLHDYVRESASVKASLDERRASYTDSDLLELIELISQYGSQVIASLLVATGYASDYVRKSTE